MSFKQTATAKEICPNYDAIKLFKGLENAIINKKISFLQAIYDTATPALIAELETLVSLTNRLHDSAFLTDEEMKIKSYLKGSLKHFEETQIRNNTVIATSNPRRIWKPKNNGSTETSEQSG